MILINLLAGCSNQNATASVKDVLLPISIYAYYGVAPDETEVDIDVSVFCPVEIEPDAFEKAEFALGNTDSIQIDRCEIFQTYDVSDDYYYVNFYFTISVDRMETEVLQFHTLSVTMPERETEMLLVGTIIVDNRYQRAKQGIELADQQELLANKSPDDVIIGYPDNPREIGSIRQMYPQVFAYTVRPVYTYLLDDHVYFDFQPVDSGYFNETGLAELLKYSKEAYLANLPTAD